jgi:FlaA1/EpsC-like NDP-sugar epimerase
MHFLLARLKADVIFHAAAYKHVPMMEENSVAVIENNFFGTDNLISAARSNGVKRFVLITTDKAVNPVSVYGASKYLCERLVLDAAKTPGLNYMVVRFGNVLGSRGSIMPLFQKQIEKGGPVTITHPEMRRYFMTIPEACSLVLKAGGVGENGKLYLLDMGEPVRIRDMAEQMIRFYGFEPEEDIKIEYIGLRPGERLDEDLWGRDEIPVDTEFPRIRRVERKEPSDPDLPVSALAGEFPEALPTKFPAEELLEKLRPIVHFDPEQPNHYRDAVLLRDMLEEVIPSLMPARALAPQGKVYGY